MIITIDGPVATGKSTVSKKVAEKLHFIHFETGAMYRCFTYFIMKKGVDYTDSQAIKDALDHFHFKVELIEGEKHYFVDDEDVTQKIRLQEVTNLVSTIAALPEVRKKLVIWQRKSAEGVNGVFEGRDLGYHVFPKAELKIYLTGRDEVRALRRFKEYAQKFPLEEVTLDKVLEDLRQRDYIDTTRECSPLKAAPDAHVVDTSDLTIEEVVEHIVALYKGLKK